MVKLVREEGAPRSRGSAAAYGTKGPRFKTRLGGLIFSVGVNEAKEIETVQNWFVYEDD